MNTPPILLKILHNSAAKPSPNFNKTTSRKGDGGFTIIELLVIVLLLGTLSAIAAPSWLAFINRQRVRTVNDRVFQSLRAAQSEAKQSKRDIIIKFDTTVDPPTATIDTIPPTINLITGLPTPLRIETFNGEGEIKPGTIALVSNASSITFDYQGNVKDQLPPDPVDPNVRRFVVTVAPANKPDSSARQCAIVETIIGGMRTAEGKDPGTGCP
jgi:type II secretory pathway pseudopilin PulG